MSPTKIGRKDRSKLGRSFQAGGNGRIGSGAYAAAIAEALRKEFGDPPAARKAIVALTSANERAVKNWVTGHNGPSGEFLVLLCRHSDQVLETVLLLAGRNDLLSAKKVVDVKGKMRELFKLMDEIVGGDEPTGTEHG